jgi:hypothetical protein
VLASSAERALSLGKSPLLKNDILSRSRVLDSSFSLGIQSTLIVEGAEKLGLKEMLVLTGEAREKMPSCCSWTARVASRMPVRFQYWPLQAPNASSLTAPSSELEARVISIQDKRERQQVLAERFAELSGPDSPVTAVVAGVREQLQLTGAIREALQNAGKLGQDTVTIQARTPVL